MRAFLPKVVHTAAVLLIVSFGTMLLVDLLPGDPAVAILGDSATPEQIETVRSQLGVDRPLHERYGTWISDLAQGDFGTSLRSQQPVLDTVRERLPVTLELAVLAQLMALSVAIPLALYSASRSGSRVDHGANFAASSIVSSPPFLIAIVLVYVFAVRNQAFPATGWVRLTDDPIENLRSAFLPALTLALTEMAVMTRVLRSDLIATLREDHILSARAIGLPRRKILCRYALRPSSFSLVTLAALSLGRLIGGAVIVETYFALPGVGQQLVNAIFNKDVVTVQGIVMLVALAYVGLNLGADMLYRFLDPRTRTT